MSNKKCDVFISYKMNNSSGKFVKQIAHELEDRGISCWYADRNASILTFESEITKIIRNCKIFLLVLDRQSARSAHVQNELALFFKRVSHKENVALFPIQVESCNIADKIGYYIASSEIRDYNCNNSENIQKLADEISKELKSIDFRSSCWPAILTILVIIALISASQSSGSLVKFISTFAYLLTKIVVVPLSLLLKFLQWLGTVLSS